MSLLSHHILDLGPMEVGSLKSQFSGDLRLQYYVWTALRDSDGNEVQPKGIVIGIHGVTSHGKFDFLNHRDASSSMTREANAASPHPRQLSYEGSWAQAFNQHGYLFCTYDQQGHGWSEAWTNSRCNVQLFDHLAFDALQVAVRMDRRYNHQTDTTHCQTGTHQTGTNTTHCQTGTHQTGTNTTHCGRPLPITFMGISIGGGVVLRALALYSYILRYQRIPTCINGTDAFLTASHQSEESLTTMQNCPHTTSPSIPPPPEEKTLKDGDTADTETMGDTVSVISMLHLPPIHGIAMCPNLSLKAISKVFWNRLLLPLARPASWLIPFSRLGSLVPNERYPWIEEDKKADAKDQVHGVYLGKLPVRMAYQNLILGPRVDRDIPLLLDLDGSDAHDDAVTSEVPETNVHSFSTTAESENDGSCSRRCGTTASSSNQSPVRRNFSLLLVHSKNDTVTDSDGSVALYVKTKPRMADLELWLLDDMWHFLTLEDGSGELRKRILHWMNQRHFHPR